MSAGSAGAFNCYIDRDIDRVMKRTQSRPLVTGELTDREALVFAYALGVGIHRLALDLHQLARRAALARRDPALRGLLQPHPQAPHLAEHRLGRRRGLHAGADRLGRRHREPQLDAVHPVPHHLPLDAAALLAAVDEVPGRLRRRRRADARRGAGSRAGRPAGHPLRVGDRRLLAAAHPRRRHGPALLDRRGRDRRAGSSYETHRLYNLAIRHEQVSPMRVFHGSIAYLSLLFLAIGIDPLLPF